MSELGIVMLKETDMALNTITIKIDINDELPNGKRVNMESLYEAVKEAAAVEYEDQLADNCGFDIEFATSVDYPSEDACDRPLTMKWTEDDVLDLVDELPEGHVYVDFSATD